MCILIALSQLTVCEKFTMIICMPPFTKKLILSCSLLLLSVLSLNSHAVLMPTGNGTVLLDVDSAGILRGAQNIDVDGTLYDVVFDNRSFTDIFVNGNGMDANDASMAILFAQAIFTQVAVDTANFLFDSGPENIFGCQGVTDCQILTPYLLRTDSVIVAKANNANTESRDFISSNENGPLAPGGARPRPLPPGNALVTGNVYADWSLSSNRTAIPEPSTLLMVALGIVLFYRRKKFG